MTKLVFLDVETTGLELPSSYLLELGIWIVDLGSKAIEGKANWVYHFPEEMIPTLDPVVQKMHTANGLFDECAESQLHYDSQPVLEWLSAFDLEKVPLTGNTVSFDRGFLRYYLPAVDKKFHYRVQDISSIKYFLGNEADCDEDYWKRTRGPTPEWMKEHRVATCLWQSLEDYKNCVEFI